VSSLVILWQPWSTLWKTVIALAVGLAWFVASFIRGERDPGDLAGGIWLVVYIAFVYVVAAIGSYGGAGWLPQPWDSIVVALGALAAYFWGVRAGVGYLEGHPSLLDRLRAGADEEPAEGAAVI
jgi:hypothetical protein